jgi:thiol-disulfide isomerase/thioredoxin
VRLLMIALLSLVLCCCSKAESPDITYKGHWVFVNYWANWCAPCMAELPALNQFYLKNKDKNVIVVGVSFDPKSQEDIDAFAKTLNISFPMLTSFPLKKYGIEGISTLPVTFVINPQGELLKTLHGPQTEESLENILVRA